MHPIQRFPPEHAARQTGLIGDQDQSESGCLERSQLRNHAVGKDEFLRPGREVPRVDERPVAVEKEGAFAHPALTSGTGIAASAASTISQMMCKTTVCSSCASCASATGT